MRARILIATLLALGALAAPVAAQERERDPRDPWEGFNRSMFSFNQGLDDYFLRPVATGYKTVTPLPARVGVANFFANLGDVWTMVNNILQGKPGDAASDGGRFLLNSTVGILGFFDVASEVGLERRDEDFGQTLAVWGVGNGPYLVLPVFGPRTTRDGGALVVDRYGNPVGHVDDVAVRNSLTGLKIVSDRTQLLGVEGALDAAALDKYNYVRDFYLKRRQSEIFDGNPPREKEEE